MDGDEQVGLLFIGDGGAGLEGNEGIVVAGVDHLRTHAALKQLAEAQGHVKDELFLGQTVGADGAGIVPAVAGVDHDLANLEPKGADQRLLAVGSGLGFVAGEADLLAASPSCCGRPAALPPGTWAKSSAWTVALISVSVWRLALHGSGSLEVADAVPNRPPRKSAHCCWLYGSPRLRPSFF